MRESSPVRISVILIAAGVVALQALLLPLSVAAAGPLVTTLCTSAAQADSQKLVNQCGCPCAGGCGTQCCAHALATPAPVIIGAAQAYAGAVVPEGRLAGVVCPVSHRPQIPRAPPLA